MDAASVPVTPTPPGAPPPPGKRPLVMWDLVLTIVLLALMVGAGALLFFLSFFLVFASDSCGASSQCDYDRISSGWLLAMILPLAIGLLALIATVIVLVFRRIAFWIPLLGIALMVGAFVLGAAVATSGVQPIAP